MQTFSIEKLYMTRQMGGSTWSPDGKQVAFISNISGRNNLWLVPASGGWPTQLTISDQRQAQPVWSPDGTWIAYTSDHDGDEQWDIFLVSPKTGDVVNLTISPESAESIPRGRPTAAARLHHQAEDGIELRDRLDGCDHAAHSPSDEEHAQGAEQPPPHLLARRQVHRLHAVARHRERRQRFRARFGRAARART
jgi:dipeptidyl aminopeptidase/acylaminoacyl peptidase